MAKPTAPTGPCSLRACCWRSASSRRWSSCPQHIIVAWETAPASGKWRYLDISKIDTHDYAMAQKFGQAEAESYEAKAQATGDASWFRRWPLKQLREELKIFPVE